MVVVGGDGKDAVVVARGRKQRGKRRREGGEGRIKVRRRLGRR